MLRSGPISQLHVRRLHRPPAPRKRRISLWTVPVARPRPGRCAATPVRKCHPKLRCAVPTSPRTLALANTGAGAPVRDVCGIEGDLGSGLPGYGRRRQSTSTTHQVKTVRASTRGRSDILPGPARGCRTLASAEPFPSSKLRHRAPRRSAVPAAGEVLAKQKSRRRALAAWSQATPLPGNAGTRPCRGTHDAHGSASVK
jgi:hypothetical protein